MEAFGASKSVGCCGRLNAVRITMLYILSPMFSPMFIPLFFCLEFVLLLYVVYCHHNPVFL